MTKRNTPCTPPAAGPRIYVACLASYNNGHLHGCWIEIGDDADAIREEIAAMLATSPIPEAEEAAIHDYEGFESVELDEYVSIDHVVALTAFIEAHGTLGAKVLDNFCGDLSECPFRRIRPPIPTTSGRWFRSIRPSDWRWHWLRWLMSLTRMTVKACVVHEV